MQGWEFDLRFFELIASFLLRAKKRFAGEKEQISPITLLS